MSSSSAISVRDLSKVYGRGLFGPKGVTAVDRITLDVARGQVFGLLGPNGAGKTTLVKMLLGLARTSSGEARLLGQPVGDPLVRRKVGYLPEGHRLPAYLTGVQMLDLFGQMCGVERDVRVRRIPEVLELVGMRDAAKRKIREYSKGMTQRIGLAQAMIHEPDVIILDEPTDGVDPVGRAAVRQIVQGLKERGATVFINSHLLQEVEMVCDRVMIMVKGKVVREGAIDELTPRTGRYRFELQPVPANLRVILGDLGAGFEAHASGFELQLSDSELDQCIDRLRAAGVSIRGVLARRLNLEQAFIQLVKSGQTGTGQPGSNS